MILNTNYWYEEYYDPRSYANISDPNAQFFMPALLSTPGGLYVLVSESGVDGTYTGSHLKGGTNGILHLAWEDKATSPYANPCVQTVPLSTPYPAVLPWRVCIIASNLNDLVNSTLIDNLSGQSEVSDVSWIKGGLSSWDWGSGLSQSLSTGKMLVDYSASMQWAFTLIDGNTPSYLGDLIAYAQPKGVGIWTWKASDGFGYSASTITQQLQSWKNLGVTGIKIDFFDNDCQQKMGLYFDIAREAAKDHLLVNFHGARAPTGWERRFPNVLSSEGIHGAEYNLHASLVYKNKCEHNCTVPFTRNVVGPMDYTPVSIHLNGGTTTYAHQMALPIIFESHIQHIAEQPSVLQGLPANAQEILRALPAGWDELKLLEGNVGNFLTMARRKGSIWYVGAISTPARTAVIPLSFLGNVKYLATIYKDGSSITSIVKTVDTVTQATTLSIPLLKTGGCAIKLQNLAPVSTDKNNVAPIASSSMNSRISMTMTIDKPIVMPSNARGFILYDVQGRQLWRYERGNGADKETIKILGKFRTQGALIVHFDFK
jgi:alpha-glucosidase